MQGVYTCTRKGSRRYTYREEVMNRVGARSGSSCTYNLYKRNFSEGRILTGECFTQVYNQLHVHVIPLTPNPLPLPLLCFKGDKATWCPSCQYLSKRYRIGCRWAGPRVHSCNRHSKETMWSPMGVMRNSTYFEPNSANDSKHNSVESMHM